MDMLYKPVNFLSNCILHFLQCQLYWMIVRVTLGFIFFIKIGCFMKGNNQNSISINGTCTGPGFVIYVLPWYIMHIAEQSLHEVMDVKSPEYQASSPAKAIHWIVS